MHVYFDSLKYKKIFLSNVLVVNVNVVDIAWIPDDISRAVAHEYDVVL